HIADTAKPDDYNAPILLVYDGMCGSITRPGFTIEPISPPQTDPDLSLSSEITSLKGSDQSGDLVKFNLMIDNNTDSVYTGDVSITNTESPEGTTFTPSLDTINPKQIPSG